MRIEELVPDTITWGEGVFTVRGRPRYWTAETDTVCSFRVAMVASVQSAGLNHGDGWPVSVDVGRATYWLLFPSAHYASDFAGRLAEEMAKG